MCHRVVIFLSAFGRKNDAVCGMQSGFSIGTEFERHGRDGTLVCGVHLQRRVPRSLDGAGFWDIEENLSRSKRQIRLGVDGDLGAFEVANRRTC